MLALNKIINLFGGWTYKTKHDLDKDSDIITSSSNGKSSNGKSSSSNRTSNSNTRIKYHKKARGTKYKKGYKSKTRSNKTRSKR